MKGASATYTSTIGLTSRKGQILLIDASPTSGLRSILRMRLAGAPVPIPKISGLSTYGLSPRRTTHTCQRGAVKPCHNGLPSSIITAVRRRLSNTYAIRVTTFSRFADLLSSTSIMRTCSRVVFSATPANRALHLLRLPAT